MKCQICPRYRVCAGVTSYEVKPIDMVHLRDLFFHEINMTDSVLSFV